MLEISQGGTLFVYQGEELGMKNSPRSWGIEKYKDLATQNYYNRRVKTELCPMDPTKLKFIV
jgi:oligo-1,6-glucosidase